MANNAKAARSADTIIDEIIATGPEHLRPICVAVRDHGACLMLVPQSPEPFSEPRSITRTPIVMVLDDTDRSLGPDGFDLPSIAKAVQASGAFAIIASAATVTPYATMAAIASAGGAVMIVETRPEHEREWIALVTMLAPKGKLIVSTVKGDNT